MKTSVSSPVGEMSLVASEARCNARSGPPPPEMGLMMTVIKRGSTPELELGPTGRAYFSARRMIDASVKSVSSATSPEILATV